MHHPKSFRSKCARSAMIPAALLCVLVSGCADQQQPTGPTPPAVVARASSVPFNKFFLAWSQTYRSSPIETQIFALDTRLDRQFVNWYVD